MPDGSPEAGVESIDPATTDLPDRDPAAAGRRARWWFVGLVLVAILPVVVAVVRALHDGWVPLGDDAFFAIRPWDVFTKHPPLLGTWSSASLSLERNINNPGPLFFDVLAIPTRLLGGYDGPAVGTALLNIGSIVGIALIARRRGGLLVASIAMLMTVALCWSMGSELIFDPWQPHSMVLPFLCFLMLVWSLSCGDLLMLPWAVAIASLLFQTHLSYAYLVPTLALWGVIALVVTRRRRRDADAEVRAEERRGTRRIVVVSVVVALLCWAQPLWEEITDPSNGNLSRLSDQIGHSASSVIGYTRGIRLLVTVLGLPPWWFRPSFANAFAPAAGGSSAGPGHIGVAELPSLALALALFGLIAVIIGVCIWVARRAGDSDVVRALVTGAIGIGVGMYTAAQIPRTVLGVAAHQFRWVWPLAAFMTFAIVITVARRVAASVSPHRMQTVVAVVTGLTVVIAVLNLPTTPAQAGPDEKAFAMPVVRHLDSQLGGLHDDGPLLYDFRGVQYAEPYSTPIMAELQRRGVPFVVNDHVLVRQLGDARRYNGHNAKSRIFYRLGDASRVTPEGGRRVAVNQALSPAERRELSRLVREIKAELVAGRLKFTARGNAEIRTSSIYPVLRRTLLQGADPEFVFKYRELVGAYQEGILDLSPEWEAKVRRYVDLQGRWDQEQIAVFVVPIR